MKRVAFAGGGSGGHCYPLLSISKALQEKYSGLEVYFITRKDSVESRILEKNECPYHCILSGKLNTVSILEKLFALVKVPIAMLQSFFILLRKRPDFVMSSGSNAGASFMLMAFLLGIPCFIYEQNRSPGIANKWMSKFTKKVFLNFDSSKKFFPKKDTKVVGMVLRKELEEIRDSSDVKEENPFSILVLGGSQGSVAVNRIFSQSLEHLKDIFPHLCVVHQSGEKNYKNLLASYIPIQGLSYEVLPYIEDMTQAYKKAHLVICRAGASTLAELAAVKMAAVLIPMPSRDKHQLYNAEELKEKGMAELLYEGEEASYELACFIRGFYNNREKLQEIQERIGALHKTMAAEKIITSIEKYLV